MFVECYIDFESRSSVSPSEVGLHNYIFHETTEILFLWYKIGNDDYRCWRIWESGLIPTDLREALFNPKVMLIAFNSAFERYSLQKLGYVIPASRFIDPQVGGRYLSLPASLDVQCAVLGVPENLGKDKRGKELIKLFCEKTIVKAAKKNPEREYYNDWNSHPKEWEEFLAYGKQDVIAEGELLRRMRILKALPLPEFEQRLWLFDQKVNDRGMPADVEFVKKMYALALRAKKEAKENFEAMTGVKNANSPTQIKAWASTQGYPYSTLKKDTVTSVLKDPDIKLTDACRTALKLRAEAASTSYQKLGKILIHVSPDGRLRNQFVFLGSSRCGRWAGSAVQIQNLARPAVVGGYDFEDQEVVKEARAMVYAEDYEGIKLKFGSVLLVIRSLIRTVFVAPQGQRLQAADLASVETRVGGWLAQSKDLNDVFVPYTDQFGDYQRNGKDPYISFATKMYGVPYDALYADFKGKNGKERKADAKRKRQVAKPGVLGCFSADTKILTSRGWVQITKISKNDLLFDGVEWVKHSGVLDKGIKKVILLNGVKVTPSHEMLVGKNNWRTAWDISQNILLEKQAINLAIGSLLTVSDTEENNIIFAIALAAARVKKDFPQNKLFQNKQSVEEPTYDILNSGPRNRFMILTNSGPLIVHNSVYRLSGGGWGINKDGDKIKTGLFGYADAMGVEMSQEQACDVVRIFRQSYPEIGDSQRGIWKQLEVAVADVMHEDHPATVRTIGPGGCVVIDRINIDGRHPMMRMRLPSSRYLHYLDARLEETLMPWKGQDDDGNEVDVYRDSLLYGGVDQKTKQWNSKISTHGGKLFENLVQGIARDILSAKMLEVEAREGGTVGHVHDEQICAVEDDLLSITLDEMIEIMSTPVSWASGLLLGADGFSSLYYRK